MIFFSCYYYYYYFLKDIFILCVFCSCFRCIAHCINGAIWKVNKRREYGSNRFRYNSQSSESQQSSQPQAQAQSSQSQSSRTSVAEERRNVDNGDVDAIIQELDAFIETSTETSIEGFTREINFESILNFLRKCTDAFRPQHSYHRLCKEMTSYLSIHPSSALANSNFQYPQQIPQSNCDSDSEGDAENSSDCEEEDIDYDPSAPKEVSPPTQNLYRAIRAKCDNETRWSSTFNMVYFFKANNRVLTNPNRLAYILTGERQIRRTHKKYAIFRFLTNALTWSVISAMCRAYGMVKTVSDILQGDSMSLTTQTLPLLFNLMTKLCCPVDVHFSEIEGVSKDNIDCILTSSHHQAIICSELCRQLATKICEDLQFLLSFAPFIELLYNGSNNEVDSDEMKESDKEEEFNSVQGSFNMGIGDPRLQVGQKRPLAACHQIQFASMIDSTIEQVWNARSKLSFEMTVCLAAISFSPIHSSFQFLLDFCSQVGVDGDWRSKIVETLVGNTEQLEVVIRNGTLLILCYCTLSSLVASRRRQSDIPDPIFWSGSTECPFERFSDSEASPEEIMWREQLHKAHTKTVYSSIYYETVQFRNSFGGLQTPQIVAKIVDVSERERQKKLLEEGEVIEWWYSFGLNRVLKTLTAAIPVIFCTPPTSASCERAFSILQYDTKPNYLYNSLVMKLMNKQ